MKRIVSGRFLLLLTIVSLLLGMVVPVKRGADGRGSARSDPGH